MLLRYEEKSKYVSRNIFLRETDPEIFLRDTESEIFLRGETDP
jgi:hypothetical protein